jgi:hypothetical protein
MCSSLVAERLMLPDQKPQRDRPHPQVTQGRVALENCHPLSASWGRYWVFAHTESIAPAPASATRPVGSTDSERAFCRIM